MEHITTAGEETQKFTYLRKLWGNAKTSHYVFPPALACVATSFIYLARSRIKSIKLDSLNSVGGVVYTLAFNTFTLTGGHCLIQSALLKEKEVEELPPDIDSELEAEAEKNLTELEQANNANKEAEANSKRLEGELDLERERKKSLQLKEKTEVDAKNAGVGAQEHVVQGVIARLDDKSIHPSSFQKLAELGEELNQSSKQTLKDDKANEEAKQSYDSLNTRLKKGLLDLQEASESISRCEARIEDLRKGGEGLEIEKKCLDVLEKQLGPYKEDVSKAESEAKKKRREKEKIEFALKEAKKGIRSRAQELASSDKPLEEARKAYCKVATFLEENIRNNCCYEIEKFLAHKEGAVNKRSYQEYLLRFQTFKKNTLKERSNLENSKANLAREEETVQSKKEKLGALKEQRESVREELQDLEQAQRESAHIEILAKHLPPTEGHLEVLDKEMIIKDLNLKIKVAKETIRYCESIFKKNSHIDHENLDPLLEQALKGELTKDPVIESCNDLLLQVQQETIKIKECSLSVAALRQHSNITRASIVGTVTQLEKDRESIEKKRSALEKLSAKIAISESEILFMEPHSRRDKESLQTNSSRIDNQLKAIEAFEKFLEILLARHPLLEKQSKSLDFVKKSDSTVMSLISDLTNLDLKISGYKGAIAEREKEIEPVLKRIDSLKTDLSLQETHKKALEQKINSLTTSVTSLEPLVTQAKKLVEETLKTLEEQKVKENKIQVKFTKLDEQIKKTQSEAKEIADELKEEEEKQKKLEDELKELKEKFRLEIKQQQEVLENTKKKCDEAAETFRLATEAVSETKISTLEAERNEETARSLKLQEQKFAQEEDFYTHILGNRIDPRKKEEVFLKTSEEACEAEVKRYKKEIEALKEKAESLKGNKAGVPTPASSAASSNSESVASSAGSKEMEIKIVTIKLEIAKAHQSFCSRYSHWSGAKRQPREGLVTKINDVHTRYSKLFTLVYEQEALNEDFLISEKVPQTISESAKYQQYLIARIRCAIHRSLLLLKLKRPSELSEVAQSDSLTEKSFAGYFREAFSHELGGDNSSPPSGFFKKITNVFKSGEGELVEPPILQALKKAVAGDGGNLHTALKDLLRDYPLRVSQKTHLEDMYGAPSLLKTWLDVVYEKNTDERLRKARDVAEKLKKRKRDWLDNFKKQHPEVKINEEEATPLEKEGPSSEELEKQATLQKKRWIKLASVTSPIAFLCLLQFTRFARPLFGKTSRVIRKELFFVSSIIHTYLSYRLLGEGCWDENPDKIPRLQRQVS